MAKVLICDDDKSIRELFLILCGKLDYTGKAVQNAGEVLREVATGRSYDLVFLDLQLIGRNRNFAYNTQRLEAYDLTSRIKEISPSTLIIGISGYPEGYLSDANKHFHTIEEKFGREGVLRDSTSLKRFVEKHSAISLSQQ